MFRESKAKGAAVEPKGWKFWFYCCLVVVGIFVIAFLFGNIPKIHLNQKAKADFSDITGNEYDEILKQRDPFVVDVHIPEQPHLVGTDAFIPYNEMAKRLFEFPEDKNTEIIVYCRSGSMSEEAAQVLAQAGYRNVKNILGGVNSYRESHQGVYLTPLIQSLGTVVYGETAKTEFQLENSTNSALKILRVSTSCSCTKAEVENKTLGPYQQTLVKVSFDPAVHKDDTDLGDIIRSIYIDTDNINFPRVESTITATVIKKDL